ncbi:MAG: GGDEF domain-containing protein [Pseudomonadota bacterium]
MRPDKLAAYLDVGTVSVFARQIVDAVDGIASLAIHNRSGQLLWAGPDQDAAAAWPGRRLPRQQIPEHGYAEVVDGHAIHFFPLVLDKTGTGSEHVATLSLVLDRTVRSNHEQLRGRVQPFTACIERQMAINTELSSLRRLSREDQKGIRLLMDMDRLDGCAGPKEILYSVLEMAGDHYGASMAAIVLPKLGIQETMPATLLEDEQTARPVMSTLGAMLSNARLHRQVLLSDTNLKIEPIPGLGNKQPRILCAPVINMRDEVIGIFVLLAERPFSKPEVRLARAITAKINSLVRTADELSAQHQSRRGLLGHAQSVIERSANGRHAMLYVDIDKLHVVNESYGHIAGDSVIQAVSRIVADLCGSKDTLCHLGSDLFAVFLHDADESRSSTWAGTLLEAIANETVTHDGLSLQVTASIGIALVPETADSAATALSTAEVATRSAKSRGGNQVLVFRDVDASVVQRRSDLEQVSELQAALIDNRFELFAATHIPAER